MKFVSLTSDLGRIFAVGVMVVGVFYAGFLTYSLIEGIFGAAVLVTLFICITYLVYGRQLLRSQSIMYSESHLKIDKDVIKLEEVVLIKEGYLVLKNNPSKRIYFNHYFSYGRMNELLGLLREKGVISRV